MKYLPGILACQSIFLKLLVIRYQHGERFNCLAMQPLAHERRPLLEGDTLRHRELLQEVAAVERYRLRELHRTVSAGPSIGMRVLLGRREQLGERDRIDCMIASR